MKNKKVLFVLLLICVLGIVGASIAYFSSTDTFQNIFGTKSYKMEVVETFESPDDWTPGTTTPKTVVATNKGNVDAAVRISFTEEWKDASNNPLPATDENNHHAAIINFASDLNKKWITSTEDGNTYYYYKTKIKSNESTSTLIDSVTFNPALEIDVNHNCVTDSETHKQTCTSETSGYAGGSYKLTIKVETIQYDQYKNGWNTNVEILERLRADINIVSGDYDTVGSEICIEDECFYVIGQEDENHVKLLSKWNLNVGNNLQTGTVGIQNSNSTGYNGDDSYNIGNYARSTINYGSEAYWHDADNNKLKDEYGGYDYYFYCYQYQDENENAILFNVYNNEKVNGVYKASIAEYVDNYVGYLEELGANVTGRLIERDELVALGLNAARWFQSSSDAGTAPSWVYQTSYWAGTGGTHEGVLTVYYNGRSSYTDITTDNFYGVRPVIILEK